MKWFCFVNIFGIMKNWFEIENKAESQTADIYIYSDIGGYDITAQSFINELKDVKDKQINVHINSLGGSVFDGLAIYNALKSHPKKVTTKVEGIAASISSVIAMAGDQIEMAENSLLMIHNPFAMAGGDANELRKTAEVLDKIRNEIANIYALNSKKTADEFIELMDVESWFNSSETLELGLINGITKSLKIENNYDISNFTNITNEKIEEIINLTKTKVMATNTQNESVKNVKDETTLLQKIQNLIRVKNAEGDDEEESEAEKTDWALTYEELKNRVDALEQDVAGINEKLGEAQDDVENKTKEIDAANEVIENKSIEIAKLKAGKTDVTPNEDPLVVENAVVDPNMQFFNTMVAAIKRRA